MFKFVCLVAISSVASAQWWPQPTTTSSPSWQQPNFPNWPNQPNQPIAPPRPPIIDNVKKENFMNFRKVKTFFIQPNTRPNFPWQEPQQPEAPQWPNWNQPQQPDLRPPTRPNFPDWNQPQVPIAPPQVPQWPQQPGWPVIPPPNNNNEVGRPGVRDSRCPAQNGRNALIFAHERECGMFYKCNNGMRCKKISNAFTPEPL